MPSPIRKFKNAAHLVLAIGANTLHLFPSRGLTVIGVTGTDGKTTTSSIIYHILRHAGKKVAVISTLGAIIDGEIYETGFHVTTPSPFSIQKYLKIAKKRGCTHLVLEVTSHAIDQNRVWGIKFDVGVLTNITHEHLDYHKDYSSYINTKLRLFKHARLSIINSNGLWFEKAKKIIPPKSLISYSLHGNNEKDLTVINMPYQIKTKLIGDFNLENILAASAATLALGIDVESIDEAVQSFEPPVGRQELVEVGHRKNVMIDFAHTPNSFESILPELKKRTKGRLIHVFGAAGARDRGKRPEMGKVASYYDDVIILTSEDPRNENVSDINRQIRQGISKGIEVHEVLDRFEAIKHAIALAKPEDLILVTGKGHEKSMNLGSGETEWSDQEAVRKILSQSV